MNIEIPEFLKEMSKQLNDQDNRITAEPIFCVYYDDKIPTDSEYSDDYFYRDDEGTVLDFEDYIDSLLDSYDCEVEYINKLLEFAGCDELGEVTEYDLSEFGEYAFGVDKVYYLKEKKFVKASLTEADAQYFIKRKQHDYPPLYIYVESMIHQPQMIELRNWIKSLTSDSI